MIETERATAAAQVVAAMAHHINNLLSGGDLTLFLRAILRRSQADVRELLSIVEAELHRVAALSAELIRKTADEIRILRKECSSS